LELHTDHGPRLLASIAAFFTGRWSVVRRILDLKTHQLGRLHGTADFVLEYDGLRFTERGVLTLTNAQTEAERTYRFVIEGDDQFSVFFADGRPFHRAEVASGIACVAHDCAPDTYRGRYRFAAPDCWSLSWRITGPRKDLVISTVFSRTGGGERRGGADVPVGLLQQHCKPLA
jgi:hypothetical protein